MDKSVAFVTYRAHPELTEDDALAKNALAELGVEVVAVPWNRENVDWQKFDAVILRSCWDYFHHIQRFRSWVDHLEKTAVHLLNPPEVVRWNAEKTYLQDLSEHGANIVPTVYAPQGSKISISDVIKKRGWNRAVIKPTVSGTSLHTWISSSNKFEADQQQLDTLLQQRNMMLQEYLPEIKTEGELSLIFFEGRFSHAVRKVPQSGDFRVQNEFGGTSHPLTPDKSILQQAQKALQAAHRDSVYARVDGVVRQGTFLLMELELIEPALFLESDPSAARRFAQGIKHRLDE